MRSDANSLFLRPEDRATDGDPLDDLAAQHQRPAELARSLLEDGITAMKIWPFDAYALASGGRHIESADLRWGAQIVEAIRKDVGDRIDIMLEYHGLWQLPPALQIADALADLEI